MVTFRFQSRSILHLRQLTPQPRVASRAASESPLPYKQALRFFLAVFGIVGEIHTKGSIRVLPAETAEIEVDCWVKSYERSWRPSLIERCALRRRILLPFQGSDHFISGVERAGGVTAPRSG